MSARSTRCFDSTTDDGTSRVTVFCEIVSRKAPPNTEYPGHVNNTVVAGELNVNTIRNGRGGDWPLLSSCQGLGQVYATVGRALV